MEVNPEAAVKFEDGEWTVSGTGLLGGGRRRDQKSHGQENEKILSGCPAHVESHDSSANSRAAQTGDSFFPLFRNTRCNMPARFCRRGESDDETLRRGHSCG